MAFALPFRQLRRRSGPQAHRQPLRLATLFFGILLVEYLVIGLVLAIPFNYDAIDALPKPWRILFTNIDFILSYVIGALCAAGLLFLKPLNARLAAVGPLPGRDTRSIKRNWLILHAVTGCLFVVLTSALLVQPDWAARATIPIFLVWLALGVASVGGLAYGIFGPRLVSVLVAVAPVAAAAIALIGVVSVVSSSALSLWTLLATPTMHAVAGILGAMFQDVTLDPAQAIISMEGFQVRIEEACSGLDGMLLISLFLIGYMIINRAKLRFPHVLIMLPVALALSFFGNTLRLVLLIFIGARIDATIAMNAFHSLAGWIFFCVLSIMLLAIMPHLRWLQRAAPATGGLAIQTSGQLSEKSYRLTRAFLAPFMVWLATGLLVGALSPEDDPYYAVKIVAVLAVMYVLRHDYRLHTVTASPFPSLQCGVVTAGPWILGALVAAIWWLLHPAEGPTPPPAFLSAWAAPVAVAWIGFRLVGTVLLVPVIEEMAFRGYLQRRLIAADIETVPAAAFRLHSVVISAAAFAMMHDNWIAGAIAGLCFSLALALRGRLRDAIVAHAVANGLLAVLVLWSGRWDLW